MSKIFIRFAKITSLYLDQSSKLQSSLFKMSFFRIKYMGASAALKLCNISCVFTFFPFGISWALSNDSSAIWHARKHRGRHLKTDLLHISSIRYLFVGGKSLKSEFFLTNFCIWATASFLVAYLTTLLDSSWRRIRRFRYSSSWKSYFTLWTLCESHDRSWHRNVFNLT